MTTCRVSELIAPSFRQVHRDIKAGKLQEAVFEGGRGSTKSSFVSIELVLMLMRNKGCHAAVLRKVGNTLRNSVYSQIVWSIATLGLSKKFHSTVSPMEITYLPTGQKIFFFGLDDKAKLKSVKPPFGYIAFLWFEELDQFSGPEEIRSVEQSGLRGGPISFTFKSFNPPAMARNWVNRYALERRDGKLVHHSDYTTVPPDWLGQRFLDDARHLRETNETAYRHEYLGEVVGSGSAVFENLRMETLTDQRIAAFDYFYFGQDWGWYPDPNHFVGCALEANTKTLYLFEEFRALRCSNADWAKKIEHHKGNVIRADPGAGGNRNVGDFRAYGFLMREAQKGPGSVAYGIRWLQSLNAIVIDPQRCPAAAREFSEYEYEQDARTGEVLEGYPDAANHSIDAVRYAIEPIWRKRGQ